MLNWLWIHPDDVGRIHVYKCIETRQGHHAPLGYQRMDDTNSIDMYFPQLLIVLYRPRLRTGCSHDGPCTYTWPSHTQSVKTALNSYDQVHLLLQLVVATQSLTLFVMRNSLTSTLDLHVLVQGYPRARHEFYERLYWYRGFGHSLWTPVGPYAWRHFRFIAPR